MGRIALSDYLFQSLVCTTFLWLWARAVWQGRANRGLGPELCDLLGASSSQPVVVKALSLRPDGMDLQVADVRKTTTDGYVAQSRVAIREALDR